MTRPPVPRRHLFLVGLLSLLALAGNAVSLPLLLGVDFRFGSIAALLALFWIGPRAGLLVAVVGSSITWLVFGHPYAIIILVAEVGVVGWLGHQAARRQQSIPMLASRDAVYWVLIGIPLTLILYHFAVGIEWTSAWLIALKAAINGILNAAITGLIILASALIWKSQRGLISFQRLLFNVLLIAILLPALLLLMWQAAGLKHRLEAELAQRAQLTAAAAANQLTDQVGVDMTDPLELEAALDALSQAFCKQIAADWGSNLSLSLEPRATWRAYADEALHATSVERLWVRLPEQRQASKIAVWRDAEYQVLLPQSLSPLADQALIVSVGAAPLIDDLQRQILRLLIALLSLALFGIAIAAWLSSRLTPPVHQRVLEQLRSKITELNDARERQRAAEEELATYAEQLESLLDLANHSLPYMDQIRALLRVARCSLSLESGFVWQRSADAGWRLLCALPNDDASAHPPPTLLAAEASAKPGNPVMIALAEDAEPDGTGQRSAIIGILINQLTGEGHKEQILIAVRGATAMQAMETGQRQLLRLIAQRVAALHLRQQLQENLIQARERETIGHLASGVSHDFNNLLGVIDANLFYLASDLEAQAAADPETSQVLAETRSALGQAKIITSGMLVISGSGSIPLETIDLEETIGDLEQIVRQVLPPRINLHIAIESGLQAFSNRAFLQSALLNLILNARDAIGDQGTLTIAAGLARGVATSKPRIGLIPALDCAEIRIIDSGAGIAPEVLEHMFEPQFSTKAKRRGHGLGLFMVREFVIRTQAGLWVEANADQGTSFRLWLPAQAPARALLQAPAPASIQAPAPDPHQSAEESPSQAATEHSPPLAPGSEAQPRPDREPLHLLLVEDDRRVRDSLARLLQAEGLAVETANHGQAALDRLATRDGTIDLVLSDIAMPVMDGLELSARLTEQYPHLPLILMTGQQAHWQPPLNSRGELVTILRKPIDLTSLRAALQQMRDQVPEQAPA